MKYKGRKKYTPEEAGEQIENTMQMLNVYTECLLYWENNKRSRADILIEALCNQTKEEMIKEAQDRVDYIYSKLKYLRQFNPNYKVKGSFGIM